MITYGLLSMNRQRLIKMKPKYKNVFKKIFSIRNTILVGINYFLQKKVVEFQEEYILRFHKEPSDLEIKRFRKRLVMQKGLLLYVFLGLLLFWLIGKIR